MPSYYSENLVLGNWVQGLRKTYSALQNATPRGESIRTNNHLTQERLNKLESIGFVWSIKKTHVMCNTSNKRSIPTYPESQNITERNIHNEKSSKGNNLYNYRNEQWDKNFASLLKYKEKYGVSVRFECYSICISILQSLATKSSPS